MYVPKLGGWKADHEDPDHDASKNYVFADNISKFAAASPASAPQEVDGVLDLRQWCSPVEDQGQIGSCFSGDTLIRLLNGEKRSLKELHESNKPFWIYSCTPEGKIVPGKATAKLTGLKKEVIKVTLDSGDVVICTPDHRWLLRDGTYCEAKSLTSSMSLMPLYVKYDKNGYQMIFDNFKSSYVKTHNMVAYNVHSEQLQHIDENVKCVHHIDFNKKNNDPENLKFMGIQEHFLYHSQQTPHGGTWYHGSKKQSEDSRRTILKQYADNPLWNAGAQGKGGTQAHINRMNDENKMESWRQQFFMKGHSSESRAKARLSLKETLSNRTQEQKKLIGKQISKRIKSDDRFMSVVRESMRSIGSESGRLKLIKYANRVITENSELTQEAWEKTKRSSGIPNFSTFKSIEKYFSSLNELKEAAENYNHKIVSIEHLDEKIDVYCLTVDNEQHNFALASGVFVHNCVGNGVVGALEFLQIRNGKPFVDLSRMFVYYNARLMSRMQDRDEGAYIHMAFGTLSSLGTCAEEKWPYDTSKVFIRPSWGSYRDAYVNKIDSYYSIGGSGQAQKNYIISALQASHPIVFGMTVDKDYMAYRGGPPVAMPKSVRAGAGGHCQVIVGYDLGRELWLVRNSWGTWWGDDGYAWVPFKYLDESSANSFWVPFLEGT